MKPQTSPSPSIFGDSKDSGDVTNTAIQGSAQVDEDDSGSWRWLLAEQVSRRPRVRRP
ncbi:hypothetical protein ES332_D12G105500v1 [Gossypium tomentosum]|uniref:Uncharacterized protein n=1 Tax=Gossypium tomentosum TaxID=34277 RepID=A0A5D2I6Z9_GOSTO|nr:hypothetical protein ES332_D12G105500v1 [Gossypium tomentosum]